MDRDRIEKLQAQVAEISAELEALKPQPEWVPFPGEIVEVRDNDSTPSDRWMVDRFEELEPGECHPFECQRSVWQQARPIPNVIQLRPHKAGDPMPCEGGERVLYRIGGGGMLRMIMRAGDLDWSKRISWAPVPRVPE